MTVIVMRAAQENLFNKKVLKSGLEFGNRLREPADVTQPRIAYSHWFSAEEIEEAIQLNPQIQVLDALPADWRWPSSPTLGIASEPAPKK